MRAVQFGTFGGPEVLECVECAEPVPADDELLIDVVAVGVNFSDTVLRRRGLQTTVDRGGAPNRVTLEELPVIPGGEVVGRVNGRRVMALCGSGGYAEKAVAPRDRVFEIPDEVEDGVALALFVQGLSAWYALRDAGRLGRGESVAIHGAAGGVGSLALQLARVLGASSIVGIASTQEKRRLAESLGATSVIDAEAEGMTARLREANGGPALDVVLEMVGQAVFAASLASLAPRGRLVAFGSASGGPGSVETTTLIAGSRSVVGFWLLDYLRGGGEETRRVLARLHALAARGALRAVLHEPFSLERAADAHRAVESRDTMGKVLLSV